MTQFVLMFHKATEILFIQYIPTLLVVYERRESFLILTSNEIGIIFLKLTATTTGANDYNKNG